MYLSRTEERMYDGEFGETIQKSMEILVALGDIYGAEGMVDISSAQISGVSYKTIGDAGLEYLEDLSSRGARVKVTSTLNPAGLDLERWREMGFSEEFAERQIRIVDAYSSMDVMNTCTCTPYLIGNVPLRGSHIAWSESSAVSYANSVLGARTNREGGPGALAAAICGKTPEYGYHLDENRAATLVVDVECELSGSDYGALGHITGKMVGEGVPYFRFISKPEPDDLKALGAAMASSGAVALYHVEGLTPEYMDADASGADDHVSIDAGDIAGARESLSTSTDEPDLVCLGCPHCSLGEIRRIASFLRNNEPGVEFWVCTSAAIKSAADRMGYTETIEAAGGMLVSDTCMVVAPVEELGYGVLGVDSAKAANYIPGMCGLEAVYDDWMNLLSRP
ncbi:aconitase X catalytic domain-containing protein [Methanothermobacter wolfeii]|uniref:aconitase X catalytic domain-containing protein n=1 Tax=Methanothermobacter wolfeii TaxID=145261 RepID=UPI0024B3A9A6|nr:aconitase X catalytic domain-containing protein [Methanothermobacter wolfeii]MDI6701724.1 aconitase X catalytic domain-containing protein [Methanothermobacter wolfeii]